MIRANIRLILPIGQQKGVTEILGRYAERTRFLAGCLSCRLYHDLLDPKAIMLEEVWDDESALNRHLGSDSFRDILLVIEMASAAPDFGGAGGFIHPVFGIFRPRADRTGQGRRLRGLTGEGRRTTRGECP
jgi:quinol monooxygenase YgiN